MRLPIFYIRKSGGNVNQHGEAMIQIRIKYPTYDYITTNQRVSIKHWDNRINYPKSSTPDFFIIAEEIDKKMNFVKECIRTLEKNSIILTNELLKDLAYSKVSLENVLNGKSETATKDVLILWDKFIQDSGVMDKIVGLFAYKLRHC